MGDMHIPGRTGSMSDSYIAPWVPTSRASPLLTASAPKPISAKSVSIQLPRGPPLPSSKSVSIRLPRKVMPISTGAFDPRKDSVRPSSKIPSPVLPKIPTGKGSNRCETPVPKSPACSSAPKGPSYSPSPKDHREIVRPPPSPYYSEDRMKLPGVGFVKMDIQQFESDCDSDEDDVDHSKTDVWVPVRIPGPELSRPQGLTPLGMIDSVPTSRTRPMTPRRCVFTPPYLQPPLPTTVIPEPEVDDPMLSTSIFLDVDKTDRDYTFVKERMRSITETIASSRSSYEYKIRPLIRCRGRVALKRFNEALEIYENNQICLQAALDAGTMSMDVVRTELTKLEAWFICIIEPASTDADDVGGNIQREHHKLTSGFSHYCEEAVYDLIQPMNDDIRSYVEAQYQKLRTPRKR